MAVAESAAGGLITAALLAVPGASAWCLGGIVIYTRQAWEALRDFEEGLLEGYRSATEANALIRARLARDRFGATWGIGETGAAGPTGNRYGDPAGHACLAVSGRKESSRSPCKTGNSDRLANMHAFGAAALQLFEQSLQGVNEALGDAGRPSRHQDLRHALDCPAALRAIARGGYVKHRVFFRDERERPRSPAYRPCAGVPSRRNIAHGVKEREVTISIPTQRRS